MRRLRSAFLALVLLGNASCTNERERAISSGMIIFNGHEFTPPITLGLEDGRLVVNGYRAVVRRQPMPAPAEREGRLPPKYVLADSVFKLAKALRASSTPDSVVTDRIRAFLESSPLVLHATRMEPGVIRVVYRNHDSENFDIHPSELSTKGAWDDQLPTIANALRSGAMVIIGGGCVVYLPNTAASMDDIARIRAGTKGARTSVLDLVAESIRHPEPLERAVH